MTKFRGGYNLRMAGRPSDRIETPADPTNLYLPLQTPRFTFSEITVGDGDEVQPGQILAKDPANYSVPLIAPRAGTVRLQEVAGHITLTDVAAAPWPPFDPRQMAVHIPTPEASEGMRRYQLLTLGAWQFVTDAHTGQLPDPFGTPQAVIVRVLSLEPFRASGNALLSQWPTAFIRGLEHLHALAQRPVHVIVPEHSSDATRRLGELLEDCAWANMVPVTERYPADNLRLLVRSLDLKPTEGPVWALDVGGVLAVDRALTLSRPATVRVISVGGPDVEAPRHLKLMPGYPLGAIEGLPVGDDDVVIINGGVFTGAEVDSGQQGVDCECSELTVVARQTEREFLGFAWPGENRQSYGRCFLSTFRMELQERITTAIRGEDRACISCGYCESVCPAEILPQVLHRYLYGGQVDEAETMGLYRCVDCALCTYVCPCKIAIHQELAEARGTLRREREEALAAAPAAGQNT